MKPNPNGRADNQTAGNWKDWWSAVRRRLENVARWPSQVVEKLALRRELTNMVSWPAKVVEWHDVDEDRTAVTCPVCKWAGLLRECESEMYSDLADYSCPKCFKMLVVRGFPLLEEEVKRGNPWAIYRKQLLDRYEATKLRDPKQLPELPGDRLAFTMTVTERKFPDQDYFIISYQGREVWREIALYESLPRFHELKTLLKARYRERFTSFIPDRKAPFDLLGDKLSYSFDEKKDPY